MRINKTKEQIVSLATGFLAEPCGQWKEIGTDLHALKRISSSLQESQVYDAISLLRVASSEVDSAV